MRGNSLLLAFVFSLILLVGPISLISYLVTRSGVSLSGPRQDEVRYDASYLRWDEMASAVARKAVTRDRFATSNVAAPQSLTVGPGGSISVWETFAD